MGGERSYRIKESKMSITQRNYNISEKEYETYKKWWEQHRKTCELEGVPTTIGGRVSVSFTPTSVGCSVFVECQCGISVDITDYDRW